MKKHLLGVTLAFALPFTALAAEDGERTYRCSKVFETATGAIMALRTTVEAHDPAEAISLCEISFDPETVEPLLREKQSRTRSEHGSISRRTVYVPSPATGLTVIAQTNRN